MAPELLRMEDPPVNGTPKGDVYSFGIIMQEILFRSYPYSTCDLTPEGTYEKFIKKIHTYVFIYMRLFVYRRMCMYDHL